MIVACFTVARSLATGAWAGLFLLAQLHATGAQDLPRTGSETPALATLDAKVIELMQRHALPGAALAIARDGQLLHARGFGWANRDKKEPVQPESLFRISSLSKPITAVAVLKLVEERKLNLDARLFEMFPQSLERAPKDIDPRLRQITVRHLLHHSAGWDRDADGRFDPVFRPHQAARATGDPLPPTCATFLRYVLALPLDFTPGERSVYSNLGYCLLGPVIEQASGQSYERFVRDAVLSRAGISRMRIGKSLAEGRAVGEVTYYPYPGQPLVPSVFSERMDLVPPQYGGTAIEGIPAAGGWIASAIDLVRFVGAIEGKGAPRLLSEASVDELFARPPLPIAAGPIYYAKGWNVRPVGNALVLWHHGSINGAQSYLARYANGITLAFLANARTEDFEALMVTLDRELGLAVNAIKDWPKTDLFPRYYPAVRAQ